MIENTNTALYAFRKFGDTVLRTAYHYTGNMSEAEDITQDVFLKLHADPRGFDSDEHLKAWLIRCAINSGINFRKSFRFRNRRSFDEVSENALSCDFSLEDKSILEKVMKLPQKYRSVIYLYYYEEYSIKEISELLDIKENTVSSQLQRARKKLKSELEEDDDYEKQRV